MTHIRHLCTPIRRLSTSLALHKPSLSLDYKSKALWEERFNCDLLGSDQEIIKSINTKILSDIELNNLEVDVFINIAAPREKETEQLCEAVRTLTKFRRSLDAHTLLPSTSQAICRLFIDSNRLKSLTRLLEKRIEYGIFPDTFTMNILFDKALQDDNLTIASRLAALIMLQEEFGSNDLNDNFALYSVSKYIESKKGFQEWIDALTIPDPILEPDAHQKYIADKASAELAAKEESADNDDDEDEEEDDAEYIRVPFLRNPYNDKHFDLNNPREISGKTLSCLGNHLGGRSEKDLGSRCSLLGHILQANWSKAIDSLDKCSQLKVHSDQSFEELIRFYMENLHEVQEPDDKTRDTLLLGVSKLPKGGSSISQMAELRHEELKNVEQDDIARLRADMQQWSNLRHSAKQAKEAQIERQKLIAEIKAKKEQLKAREQYLYFYDDLRRKNLTRIEYD